MTPTPPMQRRRSANLEEAIALAQERGAAPLAVAAWEGRPRSGTDPRKTSSIARSRHRWRPHRPDYGHLSRHILGKWSFRAVLIGLDRYGPVDGFSPLTGSGCYGEHGIVISDLHLGGLSGFDMCPAPGRARLADFIRYVATQKTSTRDVRLVVNGDIVDFLAEPDDEGNDSGFTQDQGKAVAKLMAIVARTEPVWSAFRDLLGSGCASLPCC